MRRKEEKVLRLPVILLAASLCVVQLAGISEFQSGGGMGNPPAKGAVMLADGPAPRPTPPPVPSFSPTAS